MLRKIHEVAALSGVTVRTLQYYDRINLLKPSAVTEAGYRLYGEEALETLWQILFFRELGFPLREIGDIMTAPGYDRQEALSRHRQLLLAERRRIDGLVTLVESAMKGEKTMEFTPFDATEAERLRAQYAQEVKSRWGATDAYAQSEKKAANRSPAQWQTLQAEADAIFDAFAALVGHDPAEPAVQALVQRWQAHLHANDYACTREILSGLGQMYASDPRFSKNLDRHGAGTASLMSAAIAHYCK